MAQNNPQKLNLTIIGVGGMGCLFGARLAPFARVTLLGSWPQQLATIKQKGVQLIAPNGRISIHPLHATPNLNNIPPADIILIMVKSRQTERAAQQAQQILALDGLVLTLQNGIGNLEVLTAVLPPHQVALGVTSAGATVVAPGVIRQASWGETHLAQSAETAVSIQQIATLLQQAAFPTTISDNVDTLVWGKLAINAAINPLTAILQVPNGYLAEDTMARKMMQAAANEVAHVAHAQNIHLPFPDAGQHALAVARATANNHSSMLQDVLRGVPTEIDFICGAVVKYGRKFNVPTPINAQLWAKIRKLEIRD